MSTDEVFKGPRQQIVDFVFDKAVASVFPDMIRRSVPGYELVVPMTGLLAARHLKQAAATRPLVYDLGCSLGATTLAILHALDALDCSHLDLEIRAVDNSPAMLEQARSNLTDPRIVCMEADIRSITLEDCEVVTLNWVLQFLPPPERARLLTDICERLRPSGLLILSEKVTAEDPAIQEYYNAAHLDFKRANGYSELEISQKRAALEQVMISDSIETHRQRLAAAGFGQVRVWFQCLNWASFLAMP